MALPDHLRDLAARVSNAGRWGPDDQRGTLNLIDAAAVLRRIECDATAADCELLIYLDGLAAQNRELLLWRGFRSSPEVYEFLIWPKKVTAEDPWVGDWNRWEFGFRDHDAF